MHVLWGLVVMALSLLAWAGQTVSWFAPDTAVKLTLMEAEEDVDPVYWADIRGEALWDSLSLWTFVAAGFLLIIDQPAWAYFGLVGGGMYVYFAGRGIFTRRSLARRGFRIGAPASVKVGYTFLAIWGVVGLITIIAAIAALPTG
jgi:hypothetical protein